MAGGTTHLVVFAAARQAGRCVVRLVGPVNLRPAGHGCVRLNESLGIGHSHLRPRSWLARLRDMERSLGSGKAGFALASGRARDRCLGGPSPQRSTYIVDTYDTAFLRVGRSAHPLPTLERQDPPSSTKEQVGPEKNPVGELAKEGRREGSINEDRASPAAVGAGLVDA